MNDKLNAISYSDLEFSSKSLRQESLMLFSMNQMISRNLILLVLDIGIVVAGV
jgi:hypothetical protein